MQKLIALLLICSLLGMTGCIRFRVLGPEPERGPATSAGHAEQVTDPELVRLLKAGRAARQRGDIDRPEHDNALGWLQLAMAHAPADRLVREERSQTLRAGVQAALGYGRHGNFQGAELMLTKLQRYGLEQSAIRRARERLDRMYRQRAVDLIPPARLVAGTEPELTSWIREQFAPYQAYAGRVDLYAPSDRIAIALYRQLQDAIPGRSWQTRLLHGDELLFRLHYRIR